MSFKVISTKEEIPYMMSARHLQQMGFARTMAYNFLNRSDFPVLHVGHRKLIPKDKFFEWLEKQIDDDQKI